MSRPYFTLESPNRSPKLFGFEELGCRLILFVVNRIRNGDYTERGLARILKVSQPQLHNVLKGARPLRPDLADALLRFFEINALDLALWDELTAQVAARESSLGFIWQEGREQTAGHILPRRGVPAKPFAYETSPSRHLQKPLAS